VKQIGEIMNLTLKIKLPDNDDIFETIQKYTHALNYVSQCGFNSKKDVKNPIELHKLYYADIKSNFNIKSQMACSIIRDVSSKYKTKRKSNKPLTKAISFKETHINYVYNKDFSIKNNTLSIGTIKKRIKIELDLCEYHKTILSKTIKYCDSVLVKDRNNKLYFCLVVTIPEEELKTSGGTLGIDLGLSKLATIVTNDNKTLVINGGKVKDIRNKHLKLRQRLQSKGTRSAKKLLKKISGRENRWMKDVNFCTVKQIITYAKNNNINTLGIEDLSNIRNSKLRKEQRRLINSWAFYQFRIILEYKAKLDGLNVIIINPRYTSQACSKCGHTEKANRKTQKQFLCKSCGYLQNADINAASNIELLTRLSRSNLIDGVPINAPDVTDNRKELFSNLRSSLVTSPVL